MFERILVANRGEIACRIIRTLRRMGIGAVAVYSDADAGAPHVKLADDAHHIGPSPVAQSYLNAERIIEAAQSSRAEAIHPGYGLLSERASFAAAVRDAGIAFIGPPTSAIAAMGDKLEARRLMHEAGVPVVPGGFTPIAEAPERLAQELGYPVIVKAAGGGGGIGMQIVREPSALPAAVDGCRRAAERYFAHPEVYLEKYIERPRHVEVQVIGDEHGAIVSLHERECSIQRRHQKIIEEAPSPAVSPQLRAAMSSAAAHGTATIGYTNAGTLEFAVDPEGRFYFLEMNTRLQVEHAVTEMITGCDLVEEQIRIAAGEPLRFSRPPSIRGHAIECRIYAEDPKRMLPSPGTIARLEWPQLEHVRIDSGIDVGYAVSPYYDPLLAKAIAWGASREAALRRMEDALRATVIGGVKTNIPLLLAILSHPDFQRGSYDTEFIASRGITAQVVA